jgi:hypothetical protein
MIKWIDPKLRLPPQGKKILYFDRGDVYIVQRFDNMWLPIPFTEQKYDFTKPPELWSEFDLPGDYIGQMFLLVEKDMVTVDEFERKHPEDYLELIEHFRKVIQWNDTKNE